MCNSSLSLNLSLHTLLKVVFRIGFFFKLAGWNGTHRGLLVPF